LQKDLVEDNGLRESRVFIQEDGKSLVDLEGYNFVVWRDLEGMFFSRRKYQVDEIRIKSTNEGRMAIIKFSYI